MAVLTCMQAVSYRLGIPGGYNFREKICHLFENTTKLRHSSHHFSSFQVRNVVFYWNFRLSYICFILKHTLFLDYPESIFSCPFCWKTITLDFW